MSEQMSGQGCTTEAKGTYVPGAHGRGQRASERDLLLSAVKNQVIPRLVALPWIGRSATLDRRPELDALVQETTLRLSLGDDGQGVAVQVAALHRSGIPVEAIYVDLLTPVARRLGVMWEEDECTFADVTIGMLRLQNAQRVLAPEFLAGRARGAVAAETPRALLLPVPGEQHTFGLSMVLDYFRRAGWDARLGLAGSADEAVLQVAEHRLDLVGLSFACDDQVDDAAALIRSLREASANPALTVMVGGPSFLRDPALAGRIGADGTALDGQQAVVRASELMNEKAELVR